jgi:hypothetical protein
MSSTWWIPPSGAQAMTLEVPGDWNGLIENEDQLVALVDMKIDSLLQLNQEEPSGDGALDTLEGLRTLKDYFGIELAPEEASGFQITATIKWRLLSLCETEDSGPLTFPQQATVTESQDPEETFAEWVDRIVME